MENHADLPMQREDKSTLRPLAYKKTYTLNGTALGVTET
jgi:hypothetical protein